jgi:flavin reductase (DIM6/NTAB) family NADH-FMN oxidoreductase RutF
MVLMMAIVTASLLCGRSGAEALSAGSTASTTTVITDVPPLVDVPVWSMATLNNDGGSGESDGDENPKATTNMNLLTYATPVSIRPSRLYALGLYKETKSRDNFLREKICILQLLSASNEKHIECVRLLGGISGKDVSKEEELASVHGIELQELSANDGDDNNNSSDSGGGVEQERLPKVLPGCVRYLQLSLVGDGVTDYDGGESSHDVVICKVDKMWTSSSPYSGEGPKSGDSAGNDYLSTGRLRQLGLITEQGRIAPMPEE